MKEVDGREGTEGKEEWREGRKENKKADRQQPTFRARLSS